MSPSPAAPKIVEEAAAWFARCQAPDASPADNAALQTWLETSAEHRAAYEAVSRMWAVSPELLQSVSPADVMLGQARDRRPSRAMVIGRIAAAIVIVFGFGALIYAEVVKSPETRVAVSAPLPVQQESVYTTDMHSRSSVVLPDGSLAVLDPGSEIRVAFSATARSVRLSRGQALFEVAKHLPAPFYVFAGDRRVMATGTAFDVRFSGAEKVVEVTLVEGSVIVERPNARLGQTVQMHAGERLVARDGMAPKVSRSDFDDITSWRADKLTFYEAPLSSVVAALNRYGGPAIRLESEKLAALKVDGTLRTNDPLTAANAVAAIYRLTVTRKEQSILLSEQ